MDGIIVFCIYECILEKCFRKIFKIVNILVFLGEWMLLVLIWNIFWFVFEFDIFVNGKVD